MRHPSASPVLARPDAGERTLHTASAAHQQWGKGAAGDEQLRRAPLGRQPSHQPSCGRHPRLRPHHAVRQGWNLASWITGLEIASPGMKIGPRAGELVVFELTSQVSRSNYPVTGTGPNPTGTYARDSILGPSIEALGVGGPPWPNLFTAVPRLIKNRHSARAKRSTPTAALRGCGPGRGSEPCYFPDVRITTEIAPS